jgi:hypothetical protein
MWTSATSAIESNDAVIRTEILFDHEASRSNTQKGFSHSLPTSTLPKRSKSTLNRVVQLQLIPAQIRQKPHPSESATRWFASLAATK